MKHNFFFASEAIRQNARAVKSCNDNLNGAEIIRNFQNYEKFYASLNLESIYVPINFPVCLKLAFERGTKLKPLPCMVTSTIDSVFPTGSIPTFDLLFFEYQVLLFCGLIPKNT